MFRFRNCKAFISLNFSGVAADVSAVAEAGREREGWPSLGLYRCWSRVGEGRCGGALIECPAGAKRAGTLLVECWEPGRSEAVRTGLLLTRTLFGRLATGRTSKTQSVVPDVFGRWAASICARGPSFFFFGSIDVYEATTLFDH